MMFYLLFTLFVIGCCQSAVTVEKEKFSCPGSNGSVICPYTRALDCITFCTRRAQENIPQLICPRSNPPLSCGDRTGLECLAFCKRKAQQSTSQLVCPRTDPPISCGSRTGMQCLRFCLQFQR